MPRHIDVDRNLDFDAFFAAFSTRHSWYKHIRPPAQPFLFYAAEYELGKMGLDLFLARTVSENRNNRTREDVLKVICQFPVDINPFVYTNGGEPYGLGFLEVEWPGMHMWLKEHGYAELENRLASGQIKAWNSNHPLIVELYAKEYSRQKAEAHLQWQRLVAALDEKGLWDAFSHKPCRPTAL